jgi:hypothetical protein
MLDFNRKLFKDTVFLIIDIAGEDGIGATRLNKCLIFCDALYHAYHKESLTGASYVKQHHGPVLGKEAHDYLQKIIKSGDIQVSNKKVHNRTEKNHTLNHGIKASRESFTDKEIDYISWAVSTVMSIPVNELSEITHNHSYRHTHGHGEIKLDDIYSWEISEEDNNDRDDDQKINEILGKNRDELINFIHSG